MAEETTETTETTETKTAPEWVASVQDEGLRGALSKFESQEKVLEAIGYKPAKAEPSDWRTEIKDEDAKKFAESSADINHLVKRALEMRGKLSNAIIRPSKNASSDEVASYRKALGIPEKPEEYEFPELPKEQLTDEVKASRADWSKRFHELNIPKESAKALTALVAQDSERFMQAQVEADKAFAKKQEEVLRSEWKGEEYDKNKTLANRAFAEVANRAGIPVEVLTKLETKDGRFLMDRAEIVKLFSVIGREMAEGTLGPALSESERDTVEDEVRGLRKQIEEAQAEGNSKRANQLYQREQVLISKVKGNRAIVGSQGRAA